MQKGHGQGPGRACRRDRSRRAPAAARSRSSWTGALEVREVRIDPGGQSTPDDVEMLQDLVTAATNEALRAAQALAQQKARRRGPPASTCQHPRPVLGVAPGRRASAPRAAVGGSRTPGRAATGRSPLNRTPVFGILCIADVFRPLCRTCRTMCPEPGHDCPRSPVPLRLRVGARRVLADGAPQCPMRVWNVCAARSDHRCIHLRLSA